MIRHGETDWNREGRMQGRSDIDLNSTGRSQALQLSEFLAATEFSQLNLLCSPLKRCRQTLEIAISDFQKRKLTIEPDLAETHLGRAEGLTREEVAEKLGVSFWEAWLSADWNARFPEGESKAEVRDRALKVLSQLTEPTLVFTHGGLIRRLLTFWNPDVAQIEVKNCSVYRVEYKNGVLYSPPTPVFEIKTF